MTTKQIWITILIIVLIVIIIGAVLFARQDSDALDEFTAPLDTTNRDTTDITEREPLVVTHEYTGTVHQYSGSVTLPTPCHELQADALVAESFPEQVTIVLETEAPDPETVCTQVLDQKTFDLTVSASEEARLTRVTLDGVSLPFEVFEEAKG